MESKDSQNNFLSRTIMAERLINRIMTYNYDGARNVVQEIVQRLNCSDLQDMYKQYGGIDGN